MQDEPADDSEWADDENPDVDDSMECSKDEEIIPPSADTAEITEDDDEIIEEPSYTYHNTRMETDLPVVTDLLGDVTFRIDYNAEAEIPDGSTLHAKAINPIPETEEDAVYFDTELTDSEGNVIEPGSQLYLRLYFMNPIYTEIVSLVQFRYDEYLDREVPEFLDPVDYGYTEDGGIYAFVLQTDENFQPSV